MKVLLARCDRLGDLVLALPAFAWLHAARPDWEIHALVSADAAPLVEHDPAIAAYHAWDGGLGRDLTAQLAAERYDAGVLLQYQTPLAMMLRRAGVRRRYGPWSKPASWLLLNRGCWQGRSRVARHERDYNVDLVRRLAGRAARAVPVPEPRLHIGDVQREIGRRFRREEAPGAAVVAFVHPGSGGSALDWPAAGFASVANALARRRGWRVFVTGSHFDRLVIDALAPHLDPAVSVVAERFPLRDFLGVLAAGDVMIAPSTGPLHLAAALGLGAVGLYPPAPTVSARRWGPLGEWARALTPDADCPARRHCLYHHCLLFNCLEGIVPSHVIEAATELVAQRQAAAAGAARLV
ncbi:MAG TPA: glycosyltransferase family 9 protein [Candidatus Krumholzibacteria bacterium]|nr:glycosyltransferase family 9 protein [Candidatus Krumholzibacteria bacterium]HPD72372.1 glycosyltransferase family 9 protein [Candidatus Krumholzibacteria bacterium]HRY40696.1 glycosyltransferase family 9 protein [Candidatus Krumholzibacteria bacterium]